jgi:hypothetical protein
MKNSVLEFTKYISSDGQEYSFDDNDRFLMTEEGLGMPPVEYITQRSPFQHGESLIDFRLGARTIQLQLRQNSCSRSNYWINRSLLLNGIRPNRFVGSNFQPGVLRKIFEDGSMRDIYVVISQGPIFNPRSLNRWDEWGFTETLRFIAYDPIFFDPIAKSLLFSDLIDVDASSNWELPWSFPMQFGSSAYNLTASITYLGTWISYPTIIATGPMNGLVITNTSTGEIIELNYSISAGEIVTFYLQPGNKRVENNSGTNLIGTVTSSSDLATFHIAPDPEVPLGVNTFILGLTGADANSRLQIIYNDRYIGI